MAREKHIRIPVTDDEDAEIERRARVAGRSKADWLRRVALGFERAPSPVSEPEADGRAQRWQVSQGEAETEG